MFSAGFPKATFVVAILLFGCSDAVPGVDDGSSETGGTSGDSGGSTGQNTGGSTNSDGPCSGIAACDGHECTVTWTSTCGTTRFGFFECSTADGESSGYTLSNGANLPCERNNDGSFDCLSAGADAQAMCLGLSSGGGAPGAGGSSSGGNTSGSGGGCNATEWCLDNDGDGYTNPATCVQSCASPGEKYRQYGGFGDDCYDENRLARPGNTYFYGDDRGDGSWDYNCSGEEEYELDEIGSCTNGKAGWVESIPPCGEPGMYYVLDVDGRCGFTTPYEGVPKGASCQ